MKNLQELDKFNEDMLVWAHYTNNEIKHLNTSLKQLVFSFERLTDIVEILDRRIQYLAEKEKKRSGIIGRSKTDT